MEGNKKKFNKPRALLVFGAPCSGKSTFSYKFADKFGLAFYDFDELKEENDFSDKALLVILGQILKTKQNIIFEGTMLDTEKERSEVRNMLRSNGYEPALIWVQTDITTIRQRLKVKFRNVAKAKRAYEEAVSSIEAPSEMEHPIILSGKHTFETQTKHVLTGLADLGDTK